MGCPERLTSDKAESNLHGGILSGGAHLNYKPGLNCNPRNTSYQSGRMRRSYVPHRNYLNVRSIQMQTHTNIHTRCTLLLHCRSQLHCTDARGTRGIQQNALVYTSSDRANKVSDVITFHVILPAYCPSAQFTVKSSKRNHEPGYLQRENATNKSNVWSIKDIAGNI